MAKHRILLADDSITIQKVVNLTFADEGIEVIAVGNGNSAMEKLSEEPLPDLVLADVHMPGLGGYQVCEQIKKYNPKWSHIPVMLLVGSFEPFDIEEASRVGADDFLTKPFQSIRQLVQKVHELLERPPEESPVAFSASVTPAAIDDELPTAENNYTDTSPSNVAENFLPTNSEINRSPFGDSSYDDEMIETNSLQNFQFPESRSTKSVTSDFDFPDTALNKVEAPQPVPESGLEAEEPTPMVAETGLEEDEVQEAQTADNVEIGEKTLEIELEKPEIAEAEINEVDAQNISQDNEYEDLTFSNTTSEDQPESKSLRLKSEEVPTWESILRETQLGEAGSVKNEIPETVKEPENIPEADANPAELSAIDEESTAEFDAETPTKEEINEEFENNADSYFTKIPEQEFSADATPFDESGESFAEPEEIAEEAAAAAEEAEAEETEALNLLADEEKPVVLEMSESALLEIDTPFETVEDDSMLDLLEADETPLTEEVQVEEVQVEEVKAEEVQAEEESAVFYEIAEPNTQGVETESLESGNESFDAPNIEQVETLETSQPEPPETEQNETDEVLQVVENEPMQLEIDKPTQFETSENDFEFSDEIKTSESDFESVSESDNIVEKTPDEAETKFEFSTKSDFSSVAETFGKAENTAENLNEAETGFEFSNSEERFSFSTPEADSTPETDFESSQTTTDFEILGESDDFSGEPENALPKVAENRVEVTEENESENILPILAALPVAAGAAVIAGSFAETKTHEDEFTDISDLVEIDETKPVVTETINESSETVAEETEVEEIAPTFEAVEDEIGEIVAVEELSTETVQVINEPEVEEIKAVVVETAEVVAVEPEVEEFIPVSTTDEIGEAPTDTVELQSSVNAEVKSTEIDLENIDFSASRSIVNLTQVSPDLIDAIAEKVVAKLSVRVIQEIAWEIIPELAELLIKKQLDQDARRKR